jgi:Domain of unknown function (DUF4337)
MVDVVEVAEAVQESKGASRARWIGVYIAVLAVLLSIAAMIGENAERDAAKANLDATNTWAFFQAKNIRRQQYKLAADALKLQLAAEPDMSADQKARISERLSRYTAKIARYTSDKKKKEGLDELFVRGKAHEKIRDDALRRGPYFDYGQAFLQIAIVLASVAIVTGGTSALVLSIIIGLAGLASTVNGQFMFATLPGL